MKEVKHKQPISEVLTDQLERLNHFTSPYNLTLTEADMMALQDSRRIVLKENNRFEIGDGILSKLVVAFADSPYLHQDNYVMKLDQLQAMFYYYKNEVSGIVPDDELIEFMAEQFNGTCGGSLSYLEETILDVYFRQLREAGSYE